MGIGLLEIGVKMRKAVIFQIKVCYRTVWNHPFLVGMLCFLAFMYRSFPFVFSLLVSVSPILVCTAALLGTLLSYGQPNNIPEFEWEENTTDHVVPLETELSRDATRVERYTDQERDKVDQSTLSEVHRGKRFGDHSALVGGAVVGGVSGLAAREFYEQKNEKNDEKISDAELMENQVDDESVEFDNDKSVDSFDSRRVNLDSPPGSPWKHREEALYSGSDRAESSSPDASIADIMPMLDELHPLLDEDAPQPIGLLSQDVSHAPSESSSKSSESDDEESDDVSEDQEELEAADDENEDGEDEEETQDKEDPKSAITWTEEDQRNLMDLGTSELERNQRLESLIQRRRSRKNMSLIDEKNLIDLVTADVPSNIPPISTARQNPFDLPQDNYDLGLPPIPGSAPSILLPRRNPFDLPYDPSEEKPDLRGDTFEQEFIAPQPKEPFFRRHESFSVGPSIFGMNKQDKKDIRFRPYFVPDVMAAEGTSYSPFQRQPSDISESKASSVPETESQGSIEDLEDKNLNEELDGKNLTDEHIFKEPELIISKIEQASEDVGHGSQSSEEVECLVLGAADKRDTELDETDVKLHNVENHHKVEPPIVFHEETAASSMELDPSKICSKSGTSEQKISSQSSSSSSSEVSERIFADKEIVRLSPDVETISEQPSPNGSDLNITSSSVDESSHVEPIYDASPPSIKKNISSSSIASDLLQESETGLAPEREPLENNQDNEKSTPTKEQIFSSVDSLELRPREAETDKNEPGVAKLEISKHDKVFGSASAPPLSIDSKSSTKEAPVAVEEARTTESLKVSKIQEVPPIINSPRSPESVLKPSSATVATEESESSKDGPVHKVSSSKDHEMNVGTDSAMKQVMKNDIEIQEVPPIINSPRSPESVFKPSSAKVATEESESSKDGPVHKVSSSKDHEMNVGTDSAVKQVMKNDIDKATTSVQSKSETGPSETISSKNSESSLKEFGVAERSEADAGKVDQKVVKQEDQATTTKKQDHAVELPQEKGVVTGDVEGKKENPTSQAQVQVGVTSKENEDS